MLTEQGILQALEAGKALASAVDLDLGPTVVVSPMGRAQQTLECVREELRKSEASKDFETVEIVPDIREIELFEWCVRFVCSCFLFRKRVFQRRNTAAGACCGYPLPRYGEENKLFQLMWFQIS